MKGALALEEEAAVTEAAFKRRTGHKTLALTFTVAGCELSGSEPTPTMSIGPRRGGDDLPANAVKLTSATPEGTNLEILLDVDSDRLQPGSYTGFVVLRAPYLATTRTPVAVSRSDDRWWIPLGIGALAAAVAFALFTAGKWLPRLTKKRENRKSAEQAAIVFVFIVAVGTGAFSGLTNWLSQDVWIFDDNALATAGAAFAAGTSGAVAGLLPKLWPD